MPSITPTPGAFALTVSNADQIALLGAWGQGTASSIAWSPDGSILAVGTSLGVRLYDPRSWTQVGFIQTGAAVLSMAFNPSANILAAGTGNLSFEGPETSTSHIELLNLQTGARLGTLNSPIWGGVMSLAYSPGGIWLAAAGPIGAAMGNVVDNLVVWRVADGQIVDTIQLHDCGPSTLFTFSPDGRTIALPECDGFELVTISTGEKRGLKTGSTADYVAFTADGASLLVSRYPNELNELSLADWSVLKTFPASASGDFRLSPDNHTVLQTFAPETSDGERQSQFLNLSTGQVRPLPQLIRNASFSPDSTQLAAVSAKNVIQVWGVAGARLLKTLAWDAAYARLAFGSFAPAGAPPMEVLAVGGSHGQVALIDPSSQKTIRTYKVNQSAISALALDRTSQLLAVASSSLPTETITLFDLNQERNLRTIDLSPIDSEPVFITALAFSADSQSILAKTGSGDMQAWNIATGQSISDPAGLIWSPGEDAGVDRRGHLIAINYENNAYHFADRYTGQQLAVISDPEHVGDCSYGLSMAFSSDEQDIAIGCELAAISVWDLKHSVMAVKLTGHQVYQPDGPASNVEDVVYSPYGHLLVSSGIDGTIRFWDVDQGKALKTLPGHGVPVGNVVLSSDGRYLASANYDGTYRLWGLPP